MQLLSYGGRIKVASFESRKKDHIELSLNKKSQATGLSDLDKIQLLHNSLPELDFESVSLKTQILGKTQETPFYVASMTGGFEGSLKINTRIARACERRGWLMGVGSQRKELTDESAKNEWPQILNEAPGVQLLSNIGLSQLIHTETDKIKSLIETTKARALIIHLNPLQECLQKEGTPHFFGGVEAIQNVKKEIQVPIIVKETGSGLSRKVLETLNSIGVDAVDVSGLGGTHWGRIEGERASEDSLQKKVAETFKDWGISTLDSVLVAHGMNPKYEIWGSGGVRSGLDAAKLLAVGAHSVGFAQPILAAALQSDEELEKTMEQIEFELKVGLFCTGCKSIEDLRTEKVWAWKKSY